MLLDWGRWAGQKSRRGWARVVGVWWSDRLREGGAVVVPRVERRAGKEVVVGGGLEKRRPLGVMVAPHGVWGEAIEKGRAETLVARRLGVVEAVLANKLGGLCGVRSNYRLGIFATSVAMATLLWL